MLLYDGTGEYCNEKVTTSETGEMLTGESPAEYFKYNEVPWLAMKVYLASTCVRPSLHPFSNPTVVRS